VNQRSLPFGVPSPPGPPAAPRPSSVSATPAPPDQMDRTRATTIFDRNLVVTAGAGTGKTAILVERALNLLGKGAASIDDLALITFTDKAAAELRLRLGRGLERLLALSSARPAGTPDRAEDADRSWEWLVAEGVPAEAIRRVALQGLQGLDGAAIGTIHAFCADILRRHPREAGVDPQFAADDGSFFAGVFDESWRACLSADLGAGVLRAAEWRRALGPAGTPALVRDLALALSRATLPEEARAPVAPADPVVLLSAVVRDALERLGRSGDERRDARPALARFLAAAPALLEAFLAGGVAALRRVETPLTLEAAAAADLSDVGGRSTGGAQDEMAEAALRARDILKLLAGLDETTTMALHAVAFPVAAAASECHLARGFVSFDAMLRRTRDLLARDHAVRRALGRRYRRMLVDEFQDTDPLQYEILFFLAGGETPPAADPYRTVLEPGRLFIVGDPKQSIYRFRGADIAAYRRAVEHTLRCGGEEVRLTASFRSPAALLDPLNRLFEDWLGPAGRWAEDHAPPYDRIRSALPAVQDGPRVVIASVESEPGATADERRAAEAAAIAAWVAARAGPEGSGRPHRYHDIAILFRAMTHAGLHARALRAAGVPFVIEGGKDFHERPEVSDLMVLLRAVVSPNDGPALLAVLRSPLGAVPDSELARFARAGGRLVGGESTPPDTAVSPAATDCPNLARALAWLDTFRREMAVLPADLVIQRALVSTPLLLLHAAAHDGPQRLANLRKLETMARSHAARGLTLEETIALVEEAFEGRAPEGESPLADETHDAVRVLSIHKAKGLEYPVVFVPDLGREEARGRGASEAEAAWVRHGERGLLALRPDSRRWNAAWVLHALDARRHEEAEERRVFYVACTRARERLVLVNSHRDRRAPWRDRLSILGYVIGDDGSFPPEGPLDAGVVHVILRPADTAPVPVAADGHDAVERAALAGTEAARLMAASAVPPVRWPSGTRPEDRPEPDGRTDAAQDDRTRPAPSLHRGGRAGADEPLLRRLAGLAVHAALEAWDFRDGAALLARAASEAARAAAEEPLPGARGEALAAAAARETGIIVEAFLRSPLPARLAGAVLLGREIPLLWRGRAGEVWTGACDILFEERGLLVVGDWKTDDPNEDLLQAAAVHRDQMGRYVEAVRAAFPDRSVAGEILFVRRGTAVRLDV
jgi:ATP-dependent helicase/nuclease subunit A